MSPQPVGPKVDAAKAALLAASDHDRALLRKALLQGKAEEHTWTTACAAVVAALDEPERVFVLGWLRRWVRQDGTLAEPRLEPLPVSDAP